MKTISAEFLGNFVSGSDQHALDARFPRLTHILIGFHLPFVAFLRL
jgi:hypothetical protein